jgi:hypothetical protein
MVFQLLDAIKKSIFSDYNETKYRVKNKKLVLIEDALQATCREVVFSFEGEVLVYKFDKKIKDKDGRDIQNPLILFNEETPLRTLCDYIVFYAVERNEKSFLYVFVCNLKSKNASNMEQQMLGGNDLAMYLLKTSIRYYNAINGSSKNFIEIDEKWLKSTVKLKEIAIYAELPSFIAKEKRKTKVKTEEKVRYTIKCNDQHDLDRFI